TNHRQLRLLRPRHKRPRRRTSQSRDELSASDHWITSSAVASSVSGMVRPIAFAVLRLMISSTLVACWTGRSGGLSPLYWALEVKHLFHAFSTSFTSFIPVSLFDLESRFFAPTHTCWRPARTGAVKAGRRSTPATRSVFPGPALTATSTAARWLWSG